MMKSDPVITYNHMEDDETVRKTRLRRKTHLGKLILIAELVLIASLLWLMFYVI